MHDTDKDETKLGADIGPHGRGVTPFIKSRKRTAFIKSHSIECGMLGSISRGIQMKNMLLVGHDQKMLYPDPDRLTINVGGKIFETSIKSLNAFPTTLLGNPAERKQFYDVFRDEYYFNRNQVAFDAIMYFYQSGGDIYQPEGLPDTVFERELLYFKMINDDPTPEPNEVEPELLHSHFASQDLKGIWRLRRIMWGFLDYPKSSVPARIWATTNILIIIVSVVNLVWESLPRYRVDPSDTFFIVDSVCVSYFTLDLVLRLLSMPCLKSFISNVLNWFDFLAIVPFYVELILGAENAQGLAAFRILRLFRITRLLKLIRHSARMMLMIEVVSNCLSELAMLFVTWVMGTLIFGTIMFYVEEDQNSGFESILHSCWWAAVTMTTVGYGDMYPTSPLGQCIGSIILFLSMIYIALPMTLIVSKFSSSLEVHHQSEQEKRRKYKRME